VSHLRARTRSNNNNKRHSAKYLLH
jgi:hypothetical protein